MQPTTQTIVVVAILFVSAFARSALGFGDALIAMPLLAMVISLQTATPLVAFGASTIAFTILLSDWRSVDFRVAWRVRSPITCYSAYRRSLVT